MYVFQFFLELLYYSRGPNNSAPHSGHVTAKMVPVETLQQLRSADQDLRNEEGSIFEATASAFSSLVVEMEHRLVAEVVEKAKLACRKYKAERCVHHAC